MVLKQPIEAKVTGSKLIKRGISLLSGTTFFTTHFIPDSLQPFPHARINPCIHLSTNCSINWLHHPSLPIVPMMPTPFMPVISIITPTFFISVSYPSCPCRYSPLSYSPPNLCTHISPPMHVMTLQYSTIPIIQLYISLTKSSYPFHLSTSYLIHTRDTLAGVS